MHLVPRFPPQYPPLRPVTLHQLSQTLGRAGHPLYAVATSADTVQIIRKKYIASSLHFCSQDLEPLGSPPPHFLNSTFSANINYKGKIYTSIEVIDDYSYHTCQS